MSTSNKYQPGDIEHLLLSKSYIELSKEELMLISEFASNEKEYLEMKSFMANVSANVKSEFEVVPSNKTKENLLAEFDKSSKKGAAWWTTLGSFLFPKGKSIFGKPGIQFGLMAALVIGFFTLMPSGLSTEEDLAMIEGEIDKPTIIVAPEEDLKQKKSNDGGSTTTIEVKSEVTDEITVTDNKSLDFDEKVIIDQPIIEKSLFEDNGTLVDEVYRKDKITTIEERVVQNEINEESDELLNDGIIENRPVSITENESKLSKADNARVIESDKLAKSDDKISLDEVTDLESVSTTSSNVGSVSPAATLFKESVARTKNKKGNTRVVLSKSLSEEDDLLDLLFTAM